MPVRQVPVNFLAVSLFSVSFIEVSYRVSYVVSVHMTPFRPPFCRIFTDLLKAEI